MAKLKIYKKNDDEVYSDFYNSGKTFEQITTDETIRVGFSQRQVDTFKEWEIVSTVINHEGLTVLMK